MVYTFNTKLLCQINPFVTAIFDAKQNNKLSNTSATEHSNSGTDVERASVNKMWEGTISYVDLVTWI